MDQDFSSTFLDVLIVRNSRLGIKTRWWQKECSARRILNFHSFHSTQLKRNVVAEYIRHAICITSPEFMQITIKGLRSVFRRSSYPSNLTEPIIKHFLNLFGGIHVKCVVGNPDEFFNIEKEILIRYPNQKWECKSDNVAEKSGSSSKKKYISLPFDQRKTLNKVKNIAKNNYIDCCFAPRPLNANSKKVFSALKDRASASSVRFAIFSLKCKNCDFKRYFRTFNLDVWRSAKHHLNRKCSPLIEHKNEYPGHDFIKTPKIIRRFDNSSDLKFAFSPM